MQVLTQYASHLAAALATVTAALAPTYGHASWFVALPAASALLAALHAGTDTLTSTQPAGPAQ